MVRGKTTTLCDTVSIKGQALRSEGNGSLPWSGLQAESGEQTLGENASGEPSTKDDIEAVRLCAFTPPGLPLDLLIIRASSIRKKADYRLLKKILGNVLNNLNGLNVLNCSFQSPLNDERAQEHAHEAEYNSAEKGRPKAGNIKPWDKV
jgi:hypothetical protein